MNKNIFIGSLIILAVTSCGTFFNKRSLSSLRVKPACEAMSSAGPVEKKSEWRESRSCITKSEAIENLTHYLMECGVNTDYIITKWKDDPLKRLFSYNASYGRSFVDRSSYRIDVENGLKDLFTNSLFTPDKDSGRIIMSYHEVAAVGGDSHYIAVSCEGRVHEYETGF